MVETVAWALGVSEMVKGIVGRKRPVLYTSSAQDAVGGRDSRRSMPSEHTAGAVAVAASYWLSLDAYGEPLASPRRWLAVGTALAVGMMRVTAGKHFPSHILAGTALGIASAVVVHAIKF